MLFEEVFDANFFPKKFFNAKWKLKLKFSSRQLARKLDNQMLKFICSNHTLQKFSFARFNDVDFDSADTIMLYKINLQNWEVNSQKHKFVAVEL